MTAAPMPSEKRKSKNKTPSFVLTRPLRTTAHDERVLRLGLDAGRQIYNAALGETLRRLDLMRESRDWRVACAMPKQIVIGGKAKANVARTKAFTELRKKFGFSAFAVEPFTKDCRNKSGWLAEYIGSQETKAMTKRAFKAVERYALGIDRKRITAKSKNRGRPYFRGKRFFDSVENQCATQGLRYDGAVVIWNGLRIAPIFDGSDYERQALACRNKYVRIVRRELRGVERWYAQFIQEGLPPQRREINQTGIVGLDIGPSTIAMVSGDGAALEKFCPGVEHPWREIRRIDRAMDRSRRATNPDCFNANGTWKKGAKARNRSRRYQQLAIKRRERERRLAAERKRAHGELANRVIGQGREVHTEKLSYKGWQRGLFGRSVKVRAPGAFVDILRRKISAAGGELVEINPFKTALSQFDHTTGELVKKQLKQRTHYFGDGVTPPVQRDLYSAFLARHCGPETLDVPRAVMAWAHDGYHVRRATSSDIEAASGCRFPIPRAIRMDDVGAVRASSAENCIVEAVNDVAIGEGHGEAIQGGTHALYKGNQGLTG